MVGRSDSVEVLAVRCLEVLGPFEAGLAGQILPRVESWIKQASVSRLFLYSQDLNNGQVCYSDEGHVSHSQIVSFSDHHLIYGRKACSVYGPDHSKSEQKNGG